jgi:glyoxylase-like metal-dependent hydrolase (beta-lactamase superfamily II)
VWKLVGDSNVFYLDLGKKIIIDTSSRQFQPKLQMFLAKVIDFSQVDYVIFTHFHYDHIGNYDLFPNAKLVASRAEIEDFRKNPKGAVLDPRLAERFEKSNLVAIEDIELPKELEVIPVPGHTRGSICIWYAQEKILFSGDTLFPVGIGRTDLPTSVPEKMQDSLNKLTHYNFKTLCAGHDYGLEPF